MRVTYLLLDGANPEPWQAPQGSIGRRGGKPFVMMHKSAQLEAYQQMIAERVEDVLPDNYQPYLTDIVLDVWFWRRLEQYQSKDNRTITKKRCDRSNMLKAFEDALQKLLFKNDVQVVAGDTVVVEQAVGVEPMIFVRAYESRSRRTGDGTEERMLEVHAEMFAMGSAFRQLDE